MKTGRLIVAASETDSDILYASGFSAPDPFVWFDCENKKQGIILSSLEFGRALGSAKKGVEVLNSDDFFSEGETDKSTEKLLISLAQKLNIGKFEVPRNFPLFYADALRGEGIKVVAGESVFFKQRGCKSKLEIDYITEGLRAAEQAELRVADILSDATIASDSTLEWNGETLTSERLRYEIELKLLEFGGKSDMTIASSGKQSAEPHNIGTGPIYAGEPITVDIFPRISHTGYWGDITRTYVKGKAPEIVKRAYEAVKAANEEAKKMISAGVKACDVHIKARDVMASHGFETGRNDQGNYGFIHGLGHGVGLDIHEWPRLNASNDVPLKAGEVVTVEPGLYYPEWGGIRIEDMVVVEENGCRCLNSIDTYLEIP